MAGAWGSPRNTLGGQGCRFHMPWGPAGALAQSGCSAQHQEIYGSLLIMWPASPSPCSIAPRANPLLGLPGPALILLLQAAPDKFCPGQTRPWGQPHDSRSISASCPPSSCLLSPGCCHLGGRAKEAVGPPPPQGP